jgi:signal transduction histidine kinase
LEQRLVGQRLPVLRRVGEQLRGAIYDLQLGTEQRPFVELVEQLVGEHRAMAGDSEIELQIGDGVPTGSAGVKGVEVLRILGEALTNPRPNADARHIRVQMRSANERLWTEVSDDGLGFDTTSPASPLHHGIRGTHERAGRLRGHLEIDSEPGVGTTVRLEVNPTDAESADA